MSEMETTPPFVGEPANGRERIMRATYIVLRAHGYAGLSIQRIADEAGMSKSSVYYHFEDKEELLVSFLQFAVPRLRTRLARTGGGDPLEQLHLIVDRLVLDRRSVDDPPGAGTISSGVFLEAWVQAVHDDEYRERITEVDVAVRDEIAAIVDDGIDRGRFEDADAERIAETLLTLLLGSLLRRTTTDDPDLSVVREDAYEYLDRSLSPSHVGDTS